MTTTILQGDALEMLRTLPDASAQCCVTSPPYFWLRDYGTPGQLGLERTPEEYVAKMVDVFREVRRVVRDDGTLWLNLGDSYAGSNMTGGTNRKERVRGEDRMVAARNTGVIPDGLKPKDLIGVPWMVAFALRSDGWYLRSDIIWSKPNPMPESVTDRPTKAHEYVFLLTKSRRYYYDADAIATLAAESSIARLSRPTLGEQEGSSRVPGKTNGNMKAVFGGRRKSKGYGTRKYSGREDEGNYIENGVNARTVWMIPTQGYREAHFATMPPELARRCILAGTKPGDTVLDPFAGAGTTLLVANRNGRHGLGIELNAQYVEIARKRIHSDAPLFSREAR